MRQKAAIMARRWWRAEVRNETCVVADGHDTGAVAGAGPGCGLSQDDAESGRTGEEWNGDGSETRQSAGFRRNRAAGRVRRSALPRCGSERQCQIHGKGL